MQKRMRRTIAAVGKQFPQLGSATQVQEAIRCVLKAWRRAQPRSYNDDERDIRNWSYGLSRLNGAELNDIIRSKPGEVKRSLFAHVAPFNRVSSREQSFLVTLSGRIVIKMARSVLMDRRQRLRAS